MSVRIRLSRVGKCPKKRPYFRVCVMDERRNRDGKVIETIGIYDPVKNPPLVRVNKERFDYWVSKGAQASDTVKSLAKK